MIKYNKCKLPSCSGNIIPNRSKNFCNKHQDMYELFCWCLENVKVSSEKRTESGIILPK